MSFGKGGPKEQVVRNEIDPGMKDYRDYVFNKAKSVANQPYSQYGGERVAGPDGLSIGAAGGMSGMAGRFANIGANAANGMPGAMNFGSNLPGQRDFSNPNLGTYDQAGAVGARALSGDDAAIRQMMNPYQSQVIGQLDQTYDKLRSEAALGSNDAATSAGAFGGDRHALMVGARQGEIDRAQGDAVANLLYGGYNDMMGRAGTAANLGLGSGQLRLGGQQAGADYALGAGSQQLQGQGLASQYALGRGGLMMDANQLGLNAANSQANAYNTQFGMGDYFRGIHQAGDDARYGDFIDRRDWGQHQLGTLTGAMNGSPSGSTQTQPMQSGNRFTAAAGGAATGFGIGGPIGAGIGGLGGLLFG